MPAETRNLVDDMTTGVAKVDPKTDKMEMYLVPKGFPRVGGFGDIDNNGNAWFAAGHGAVRLDAVTHEFKSL